MTFTLFIWHGLLLSSIVIIIIVVALYKQTKQELIKSYHDRNGYWFSKIHIKTNGNSEKK
ncbi:hypothetical protein DERP_002875 [Dermatophagoides pteronyssinus]|uniref:Uncharacterized protein n=1 Tax=Dermatophagoides pteronyssinus TaxID=6956 RepID=A0ABQ8JWH3_DERPT|nr:hypothetical protein DERP_002875 [Dermatophagoides pteronyssinus]